MGGHHHHHHHGHAHHHHNHAHEDGHEHPNSLQDKHVRKLRWVLILTAIYLLIELVGGILSHSLALLADAGHMLGDTASIAIALFAAWFAARPVSPEKTFGFYRAEILAAFINGLLLLVLAVMICLEAFERFQNPLSPETHIMLPVAIGGFVINLAAAAILHAEHHTNLNIKGAYLHVMGDLLGSVGAIAASLLIILFGWTWADPAISAVIAILVIISAVRLIREAANILLEGCPFHIDVSDIEHAILDFDGVQAVHNLHVWNINIQMIVLTAHVVVAPEAFQAETLTHLRSILKDKFGLSHVTLQLEVA